MLELVQQFLHMVGESYAIRRLQIAAFRDALHRYVPSADRVAWIEEVGRRADLQIEANGEAKKKAAGHARREEAQKDESFMAEVFDRLKRG